MFGKAARFGTGAIRSGVSTAMSKEKRQAAFKKAEDLAQRAATNLKAFDNAACSADQIQLNSRAIAQMGKFIESAFPDKTTGTVFKKHVQGYHSVAGASDCKAIYDAARKEQEAKIAAKIASIGGKSRRRKRRKSRKKRRKSRKKRRKSRRKRRKSRRRRRR